MTDSVVEVFVPRLNANDEFVQVTALLVKNGQEVAAGDVIAEVETAKATTEIEAPESGVIRLVVELQAKVEIATPIAYLGPDQKIVDEYVSSLEKAASKKNVGASKSATPKAQRLIEKHSIDIAAIDATGTIKVSDVEAFLASHETTQSPASATSAPAIGADAIPGAVKERMTDASALSGHQREVISSLRKSTGAGIFTTLEFVLNLAGPNRTIEQENAAGRRTSLLPVILGAISATLPKFPLMMSVTDGERVYQHDADALSFVARAMDGRLYTPRLTKIGERSLAELSVEAARLTKQSMKNALSQEDMGPSAMTVSLISLPGVRSFQALPAPFQAAIIAVGAPYDDIRAEKDGTLTAYPSAIATVTYDHSLCDGIYVADFMAALNKRLNDAGATDA